jgi:hypothetical protein
MAAIPVKSYLVGGFILTGLVLLTVGCSSLGTKPAGSVKPSGIIGTWSTFVFDDKPYGDAVAIYEFRDDGRFRILIIPVQIAASHPDRKPSSSNPISSIAVHGTFHVNAQQVTLAEDNIPSPKTLTFRVEDDVLTVSGPDVGDPLILMRTRSEDGP